MDHSDTITPRTSHRGWLVLGSLLLVAACEHATSPATTPSTTPGPNGTPAVFSVQASIGDLKNRLDSGVARVRIRLVSDSLVARRVVLEQSHETGADEKIEGRVTAVASGATADTLTLDLGGLKVVVDTGTVFRGEGGEGDHGIEGAPTDGDSGEVGDHEGDGDHHGGEGGTGGTSLADFTMRLQMALADGRRPFVALKRHPGSSPEAPGDSSFVAASARLDDADDAPEIELNVDSLNFTVNGSPPPAAWITVLGRRIEIRDSTVIKSDLPRTQGVMEFSDTVASADTAAHTVTLKGGAVLRIVAGTEIETEDGNGLASVADVAAALMASKTVLAHGRGLLETATPTTLDVIEVVFHLGT